jgi:hypothetical protein
MRERFDPETTFLGFAGLLAFYLLRGVLLWILVPVAWLIWAFSWPIWKKRNVRAGQFIGWADLNFQALLHRSLFRPFVKEPVAPVPVSGIPQVTHRVGWTDAA